MSSAPVCPPICLKLFCWFILTLLSACIAEIPSGSSPLIMFQAWGWMVTIPLYGLHLLLLATLVLRLGRPALYALFFAGAVFGLYEAYITKVLWAPPWEPNRHLLLGLAVPETVILTLWWHNWMAFILPLMAGEALLTRSRETLAGLPAWARGWLLEENGRARLMRCLIVSGGLCGLFVAGSPNLPRLGGLLIALQGLAVLGLIWLWRAWLGGTRYTLRELLPRRWEIVAILLLVEFGYIALGTMLRWKALPNFRTPFGRQAHYTIWMLYGLYGTLLWLSLRRSRREALLMNEDDSQGLTLPVNATPVINLEQSDIISRKLAHGETSLMPWRPALAWLGAFSGTALIVQPVLTRLGQFSPIFMVLGWLAGGLLGLFMLALGVRYALGGRAAPAPLATSSNGQS